MVGRALSDDRQRIAELEHQLALMKAINTELKRQLAAVPGHWHCCPQWDLLLINDSTPEFASCLCYKEKK